MLRAREQQVVVVGPDQEPETIHSRQARAVVPVMPSRKEVHVKTTLFLAFYTLAQFAASEPLYKGVTCFCSLQKCQMTNNLCTSYYGCYQMSIVVPEDPQLGARATPSTYTALAACLESRSQNRTHCGPEQLYKQSSPNTQIKCCYKNLCNDITGNPYSGNLSPSGGSNHQSSNWNINNQYSSNGGLRGGTNVNRGDQSDSSDNESIWSSDFWFRIAVITVPITGAVILVFLIIVAIKLLRQEDMRTKVLAQQKLQTLTALHRGCTEHYCHLTGSVITPQSEHVHTSSKSDNSKMHHQSNKNVCQYSPTRHPAIPAVAAISSYSNQPSALSHELPKLINNNNVSPYSKCDTIQVKPVVTRPPDICECHSPETAPTQILAARPSPAMTRPYASFHIYPKNGIFGGTEEV